MRAFLVDDDRPPQEVLQVEDLPFEQALFLFRVVVLGVVLARAQLAGLVDVVRDGLAIGFQALKLLVKPGHAFLGHRHWIL